MKIYNNVINYKNYLNLCRMIARRRSVDILTFLPAGDGGPSKSVFCRGVGGSVWV